MALRRSFEQQLLSTIDHVASYDYGHWVLKYLLGIHDRERYKMTSLKHEEKQKNYVYSLRWLRKPKMIINSICRGYTEVKQCLPKQSTTKRNSVGSRTILLIYIGLALRS